MKKFMRQIHYLLTLALVLEISLVSLQAAEPRTELAGESLEASSQAVNLPANFTPEAGTTKSITVGCRDGKLETWCISQDLTSLMRYNPSETAAASAWVKIPAVDEHRNTITPLKCVSASSDGVMMILDGQGKAYLYDWEKKNFTAIPERAAWHVDKDNGVFTKTDQKLKLDRISVGGVRNVWAVDDRNNVIYQLHTSTYTWMPKHIGIQVAAGVDGMVIIIDPTNIPYHYIGKNNWAIMQGVKLDHIAVASRDDIYGSYEGALWQFTNNAWAKLLGADGNPTSGVAEVAVNGADTLFITDVKGKIYNDGEGAVEIQKVTLPSKVDGKPEEAKVMGRAAPMKKSRYRLKAMKTSPLRKRIADAQSMATETPEEDVEQM